MVHSVCPIIAVDSSEDVVLDVDFSLNQAKFIPSAQDLLVEDSKNQQILLQGYYAVEPSPTLIDTAGMALTPAMVASMISDFGPNAFEAFTPFDHADTLTSTLKESTGLTDTAPATEANEDVFTVPWGRYTPLTAAHVGLAEDSEFSGKITLLTQGQHGFLVRDNIVMQPGDTFTLTDLRQGSVIYYHDETSGDHDEVMLHYTAEDGFGETSILAIRLVSSPVSSAGTLARSENSKAEASL